ncbi:MAG: theronine dehydrogenase, partial [Clostridiales bacterium]|nr:theronine dehydrogenase [Clostridiales bacterium]
LREGGVEIGEPVLVMGVGILGMMAIRQLRAAGAVPVIAADPVSEKREKALALGADYAFDPFASDFSENVKAVSHGGVSACVEVTGFGSGLDLALDCMRKYGRIALLGCTRHSDFSIDYYHKVHAPGISLIGAHTIARPAYESSPGMWTQKDDMRAQLNLLALKRLNYRDMIEETHSPEEAPEVYHRLCTEKSFPIVQFDWRQIQ